MTKRSWVRRVVDGMFDFGRIARSALEGQGTVVVDIEGDVDENGEPDELATSDLWGCSALQYRPADPTDDGAAETIYLRRGDELVPLATRDFRFQVDLDKGEVVVTNNCPDKPARIWLTAAGKVIVEADEVRIGDGAAAHTIGLGDRIAQHLADLKSYIDGHTHTAVTTATIGAGETVGVVTVSAPRGPSPVVPDVESVHLVE